MFMWDFYFQLQIQRKAESVQRNYTFKENRTNCTVLFCWGHPWEIRSYNLELDLDLNEIVMLHASSHLTEQQKCKTLPSVTVDGIISCGDCKAQVWDGQKSVFTLPLYCPFLNASYFHCAADFKHVKNRTHTLSLPSTLSPCHSDIAWP